MLQPAVILGGGFAGLWMAAELLKRGYTVEVYERSEQPGGLLRSYSWNDLAIDIGPHIYFAEYTQYYEPYLARPLQRVDAYYAFGFRGRQIRSPITPKNMFRDLPLQHFAWLTISFLWGRLFARHQEPKSAAEWAIGKYGAVAYRYFFRDYIPKLTGLEANQISPDWGSDRERFYKQHNLLAKSMQLVVQMFKRQAEAAAPLELYYAPGGAGEIIDGLQRYIKDHGGVIYTGHQVERIEPQADQRSVRVLVTHGGQERWVRSDCVISTLTLPNLIRLISDVPEPVIAAARQLKFRHLICLYYVLRRPRLMDKMQIYFTEKKYWFKRVYETPPLDQSEQRYTCICAEVCYTPGDAIGQMPQEQLHEQVRAQLMDYYGLHPEDFEDEFALRAPNAYAVYTRDYRQHLGTVAEYLYRFDGLTSFGRAGLFRYNALTDRIIDASKGLLAYLDSGCGKKAFLQDVKPKGDFL